MPRYRRTKIVATLGPSTDLPEKMDALIKAGANVMRINLSHGSAQAQRERILLARASAKALNKIIGILVDLQGPKIRIAQFHTEEGVMLKEGDSFTLDAARKVAGDQTCVGLDYAALPEEVFPGDQLLLDDGRVVLTVTKIQETQVQCIVTIGGKLFSYKGLNRKGGGLSAPSLTDKDKKDIVFLAGLPIDYVALSFPIIVQAGSPAKIIAKIERKEAVDNIDEIIEAADAVMVARGDLGVEMGYAGLPGVQKYIIRRARFLDKAVIVATQMMESMVHNPLPTRAEVSDVANAILDGTDAVMLSAETATGDFPIQVVSILDEICLAAEQHCFPSLARESASPVSDRHDKAIAEAAMQIANQVVPLQAIVALTESGSTPLWMSRIRSEIPIYALSRHADTCGRVTLFRGVYPVEFDVTRYQLWEISRAALSLLVEKGILQPGNKVILTKGEELGVGGKTNGLKILTV